MAKPPATPPTKDEDSDRHGHDPHAPAKDDARGGEQTRREDKGRPPPDRG